MKTVQLQGGPMDGQWRAIPDDAEWLKVRGVSVPTNAMPPALGFYGPSVTVPDGVWKWNGLYG